jgi:hypothetical protein
MLSSVRADCFKRRKKNGGVDLLKESEKFVKEGKERRR